jgi:putative DNA-invertase from lambdoid prophage Rac
MTLGVINAVAQFERDLLIERTWSGLARVKSEGTVLGRPMILDTATRGAILRELAAGASISALARKFGASRQTIMRARDAN